MLPKVLLEERLRTCEIFKPKTSEISLNLPNLQGIRGNDINQILRHFYQGVSKAIFAGELEFFIPMLAMCPDSTDFYRERYIEVKSVGHTRRVMLKDRQIRHYADLQFSNSPIKNPRIYFSVYRYGLRGIWEKFIGKNSEEVIRYLAANTRFVIGLPFSVIHTIHSAGYKEHKLASRRYGKGTPATHFSSTLIDLFFSEPEKALREFGLNPENFIIRYRKLLPGIKINTIGLEPFPLVLIKDKDDYHAEFIEDLRAKPKA